MAVSPEQLSEWFDILIDDQTTPIIGLVIAVLFVSRFQKALSDIATFRWVKWNRSEGVPAELYCLLNFTVALAVVAVLFEIFIDGMRLIGGTLTAYYGAYKPLRLLLNTTLFVVVLSSYTWFASRGRRWAYIFGEFRERGVGTFSILLFPILALVNANSEWIANLVRQTIGQ